MGPVLAEIDALFEGLDDHSLLIDLLSSCRIGEFRVRLAHTHVRLNATQLHNAIHVISISMARLMNPGTDAGLWES